MVTLQQVRRKLKRDGIGGLARAAFSHLGQRGRTVDENALIAEHLLDGRQGTMIDVGACHGSALLPFAERGWQVVAFEPDPTNRQVLLENIEGRANVVVRTEAISEIDGQTLEFYASPESPGVSSLTPFLKSHKPIAQVQTVRLDTFLAASDVGNVDYLKIDAEGHDLFVLRTYPFEKKPPKVVLCEFEDRKTKPLGYAMTDMADLLVDAGYAVFVSEWHPIERYGSAHRWRRFARYPMSLADNSSWGNLIGIRNDSHLQSIAERVFTG